jgi:hypothetical protein
MDSASALASNSARRHAWSRRSKRQSTSAARDFFEVITLDIVTAPVDPRNTTEDLVRPDHSRTRCRRGLDGGSPEHGAAPVGPSRLDVSGQGHLRTGVIATEEPERGPKVITAPGR